MRRTWAMFLLAVLVLAAIPARGDVTPEELEEAKGALVEIRDEAQRLADAYEAALEETERLEWLIASSQQQAAELDEELIETRLMASDRAVDMYIGALSNNFPLFTEAGSLSDVEAGLAYMRDAGDADQTLLNQLAILERDVVRVAEELAAAQSDQVAASQQLELAAVELSALLESAQAEYNELYTQWQIEEAERRAEAERKRQEEAARSGGSGGAPPVVVAGRKCPVNGWWPFRILGAPPDQRALPQRRRHVGRAGHVSGGDRVWHDLSHEVWGYWRHYDLVQGRLWR